MEELKWYTVRREFLEGWPMIGLYLLVVVVILAVQVIS